MSNLKQIGLGVMMYVQDYDERYPTVDGGGYWPDRVQPYINSKQVFICPSGPEQKATNYLYGNYGANASLLKKASKPPTVSMAAVVSPSTIYMIFDASFYQILPYYGIDTGDFSSTTATPKPPYYLPGTGPGSATNLNPDTSTFGLRTSNASASAYLQDFASGRHFGGINMAFADGHVKWLLSQDVYLQAKVSSSKGNFNPGVDH